MSFQFSAPTLKQNYPYQVGDVGKESITWTGPLQSAHLMIGLPCRELPKWGLLECLNAVPNGHWGEASFGQHAGWWTVHQMEQAVCTDLHTSPRVCSWERGTGVGNSVMDLQGIWSTKGPGWGLYIQSNSPWHVPHAMLEVGCQNSGSNSGFSVFDEVSVQSPIRAGSLKSVASFTFSALMVFFTPDRATDIKVCGELWAIESASMKKPVESQGLNRREMKGKQHTSKSRLRNPSRIDVLRSPEVKRHHSNLCTQQSGVKVFRSRNVLLNGKGAPCQGFIPQRAESALRATHSSNEVPQFKQTWSTSGRICLAHSATLYSQITALLEPRLRWQSYCLFLLSCFLVPAGQGR